MSEGERRRTLVAELCLPRSHADTAGTAPQGASVYHGHVRRLLHRLGEYITQVTGIGPLRIGYMNAKDDPCNGEPRQAISLT